MLSRRQLRLELCPAHPTGAILVKTFQSPRKLGVLGAEERQLSAAQAVPKLADQRQTFRRAKAGDLVRGQNAHEVTIAPMGLGFKTGKVRTRRAFKWRP